MKLPGINVDSLIVSAAAVSCELIALGLFSCLYIYYSG